MDSLSTQLASCVVAGWGGVPRLSVLASPLCSFWGLSVASDPWTVGVLNLNLCSRDGHNPFRGQQRQYVLR